MATTITKLFPTGILQSSVEFDEVTYSSIKVSPTGVYAAQFDEVSLSTNTAESRSSTGTYRVSGYFDEYTLNAPITPTAGSIQFTSTPSQYLSIPNNSAFTQNQAFTYECWFRPTTLNGGYVFMMLQHNWIGVTYRNSGKFVLDMSYVGNPPGYVSSNRTYGINAWYHIALTWTGTNGYLFINGVQEATFTGAGSTVADGQALYIGQYQGQGQPTPLGYVSNFRVVKGTAVYSAPFTPPTSPLTAISGTQLLLNTTNDANFLKDNSTNNFTVTNNGSVTSAALAPF